MECAQQKAGSNLAFALLMPISGRHHAVLLAMLFPKDNAHHIIITLFAVDPFKNLILGTASQRDLTFNLAAQGSACWLVGKLPERGDSKNRSERSL